MSLGALLLIAIGLSMDAFAVALGVGTTPLAKNPRVVFRLAFHFGLFQGLMVFLGWLAGRTFASFITGVDHWIVFILLAFVGGRMIQSGLKPGEEDVHLNDPSRGSNLVILSIATSLDAMAVGIGMALLNVDIVYSCVVVALVTFALSLLGVLIGNRLGKRFGKRMEVVGGIILIVIGVRILISHLFPDFTILFF